MAVINHVIVLMLENRSFDSLLGMLRPVPPGFNGLSGHEYNEYNGSIYAVNNRPLGANRFAIPDPDPGETFLDITQQIYGSAYPPDRSRPIMSGFAANYAAQSGLFTGADPAAVMHYYTKADVPMLHQLALAFGVSDQWFASAPCQTWPNRFFAHTGSSDGVLNNRDFFPHHTPFGSRSIFAALEDSDIPWRIYFHDVPQSILLADVLPHAVSRMRHFRQFLADAQAGALPRYSFIEPEYFADVFTGTPANDQHPPHDIRYAEKLIADVYNAVRASPCWDETLLVISYDEHGGLYDHAAPPPALAPDGAQGSPFTRFGVRVPAVIISPWLPPGSLLQPLAHGSAYPFDHTSIIKTVQDCFALANPLTNPRIAAAPSLLPFLTLPGPTNDGPARLVPQNLALRRAQIRGMGNAAPSGLQLALARVADGVERGFAVAAQDIGRGAETVAQLGIRAAAQIRNATGI